MGLFDLFGKKKEDSGERQRKVQPSGKVEGQGEFEVQDVYQIMGVGTVPVGKVVSGSIRPGQKATVNGIVAEVKTIERNHMRLEVALQGEFIGINLSNVSKNDIKRGEILSFR